MSLTAAEILAVEDRVVEKVKVKEWGGDVFVRSLTTGEAIELNAQIGGSEDSRTLMLQQLAAFMCDEKGTPLFADATAAARIIDRKPVVLNRVIKAGQRLNHAESQEDEKAK